MITTQIVFAFLHISSPYARNIFPTSFDLDTRLIAALTREHRRRCRVLAPGEAQPGPVPCSDALARQGKALDEVIAAILAGAQASARTPRLTGREVRAVLCAAAC